MRNVEYITNGFGAPTNYNIPGPMGNQFATPFGDPYRVDGVSGFLGNVLGSIGNVLGGVGKVLAPVLPGLAQVGVGSLLNKAPKTTASQQTSQSQFTQVTEQAQVQQTEKSNTAIYVAVGAAALIAAYFFLSKRRR